MSVRIFSSQLSSKSSLILLANARNVCLYVHMYVCVPVISQRKSLFTFTTKTEQRHAAPLVQSRAY